LQINKQAIKIQLYRICMPRSGDVKKSIANCNIVNAGIKKSIGNCRGITVLDTTFLKF